MKGCDVFPLLLCGRGFAGPQNSPREIIWFSLCFLAEIDILFEASLHIISLLLITKVP